MTLPRTPFLTCRSSAWYAVVPGAQRMQVSTQATADKSRFPTWFPRKQRFAEQRVFPEGTRTVGVKVKKGSMPRSRLWAAFLLAALVLT